MGDQWMNDVLVIFIENKLFKHVYDEIIMQSLKHEDT
jgi:hypothetical protein